MFRRFRREHVLFIGVTVCALLNAWLWRVQEIAFSQDSRHLVTNDAKGAGKKRLSNSSIPVETCLCGIVSFFNPSGYRSKLVNFRRFRNRSSSQGLWLRAVELSFNGSFELTELDAESIVQIEGSSANLMWQKERLLNVALENLPGFCKNVVWPDIEVLFRNNKWVSQTCEALKSFAVVQPFAAVFRLPPGVTSLDDVDDDVIIGTDKSNFSIAIRGFANSVRTYGATKRVLDSQMEHGFTGYAWAARREVIQALRMFDVSIVGGGDALMAHAFVGHVASRTLLAEDGGGVDYVPYYYEKRFAKRLERFEQSFGEYAQRAMRLVDGSVSFVDGIAYHLWHGSKANRQYENRFRILQKGRFDPYYDVQIDRNGAWAWATFEQSKARMHKEVAKMFERRKEDSIRSGSGASRP